MIKKEECKKLINKILNKKRFYEYHNFILELLIQLYLILTNKRKMAQIFVHTKFSPKLTYKKLIIFLDKNYKYYYIRKEEVGYMIVIYHKKYNINKLNKSFGKKYGQNLNNFYVCAGNLNKLYNTQKYLLRPVISVSYNNNKKIYFELLAQMCIPNICIKHFDKFISIKNKYQKYLQKINKDLYVKFELQKSFG